MVRSHGFGEAEGCAHSASDLLTSLPHALPGDRPQWPRDRVFDVRHIKLQLTIDHAGRSVSGTATHTVAPINDDPAAIEFDAVEMEIEAVLVAGEKRRFDYDGRVLRVPIEGRRPRGQDFRVAIRYRARPRLGLYFVGPDEGYPDKPAQVWSQSQDEDSRYWFPCYDYPNQKQTTELHVTVPGGWYALSNGRLLQEKANRDGTRTFHWLQESPHSTYLVTLAASDFERIDASRRGLSIEYLVEQGQRESGQRTFKNTPAIVEFFERITGVDFPWAKYHQVVVRDFVFGGMENTSATTMTENILLDAKSTRDYTSDPLISLELAHMWWGDLLTCRDWSHGWLNVGFATFFELLWDEQHLGLDEYRQGLAENAGLYLQEAENRYQRPIVTNVFRDPIDIFDRHLYEKGSLVLASLRGMLGDEQFFRAIRRYCNDHRQESVVTGDLADSIAAETGRNLDWFFDQWVYRPGHPELKVSWAWDNESKTAADTVQQTQKLENGVGLFRLPLAIDFARVRGRPLTFPVEIREQEQTFTFPLPWKPDLCRFDPSNTTLKQIDFEKSPAELRLQLRIDDDIAGRQQAAASLGKKGGPEAIEALETAVMRDRFWGVQAAAARALGVVRTSEARDALLRALAVRHPKARRAGVAAVGEFRGDQAVLDAVVPLARRSSSWFVEAEACRTIGKLRLPASFPILERHLARPSFQSVVRIGCIDGLVELRDERGLGLIAAAARYGEPSRPRPVAVNALARLGVFLEDQKKRLADELLRFLNDPDFRVRVAAMNALRTLKDPAHAGALDATAQRELDGRAVRAAREAAAALRQGDDTSEETRRLRDDFEQLREENARLRGRLDRLETRKK